VAKVDWDGAGYHRVAGVQERWGVALLGAIPPGDHAAILDAGCGSGRMTAHLLRRFPRARVVGIDRSRAMLDHAARVLGRFRGRLDLVQADLTAGWPGPAFDLVYSNATFHWIADHARLFCNLRAWLRPGGWLVAQCGGAGNLRRSEALGRLVSRRAPFAPELARFRRPVHYAPAGATRRLLREAGFVEASAWLVPAPTRFRSRRAFRDFLGNVILVPQLSRLRTPELREVYVDAYIREYERRIGPPFVLDYVRLNIKARVGQRSDSGVYGTSGIAPV
jgi:trans-aconitate 2-methyltransferase